jgi:hypothetical protein
MKKGKIELQETINQLKGNNLKLKFSANNYFSNNDLTNSDLSKI